MAGAHCSWWLFGNDRVVGLRDDEVCVKIGSAQFSEVYF